MKESASLHVSSSLCPVCLVFQTLSGYDNFFSKRFHIKLRFTVEERAVFQSWCKIQQTYLLKVSKCNLHTKQRHSDGDARCSPPSFFTFPPESFLPSCNTLRSEPTGRRSFAPLPPEKAVNVPDSQLLLTTDGLRPSIAALVASQLHTQHNKGCLLLNYFSNSSSGKRDPVLELYFNNVFHPNKIHTVV